MTIVSQVYTANMLHRMIMAHLISARSYTDDVSTIQGEQSMQQQSKCAVVEGRALSTRRNKPKRQGKQTKSIGAGCDFVNN